jgi:pimeloyl-ACP methyl ester carboxylesterase
VFKSRRLSALVLAAVLLLPASAQAEQNAAPPAEDLRSTDHYVLHRSQVPVIAGQPVRLYVQERALVEPGSTPSRGTVLIVHGATYPTLPAFDIRHEDYSWMDFLARAGFRVFAVDMEGYGKSSRPWPMEDPCNLSPANQQLLIPDVLDEVCEPSYPSALTTNESDWAALDSVVDFIRKRAGDDQVSLIGWSQGGTRTGGYAALHPEKVEKLVAFAPAYQRNSGDAPTEQPAGPAFTIQDREGFLNRWNSEVSCEDQVDPAVQEALWRQSLASDPVAATWGHGFIRRPTNAGLFGDGGWNAALAAQVRAPALLIAGDLDETVPEENVRDLYEDLGSRRKMFVLANCASHFMHAESDYQVLQDIVLSWLVRDLATGGAGGAVEAEAATKS